MLYWIKWIWEMEGNYVGKESNEGSSQMRQWIDEIGIGPLVLNVTIHLSIQWNSWGFAAQSKIDSLSFRNRFLMMKIYVRFVEYLQTQLVQHDWSHMTDLNVLCQGKDLLLKRAMMEVISTCDTNSVTLWIAMFGRCKSKFSRVITVKQQVTPCEFLIHFAPWSNICVFHNLMRICRKRWCLRYLEDFFVNRSYYGK